MHARIPTRKRRPRAAEHGFSLVEVIVVLLIIAILGGLAMTGKQSTQRAGAISAARAAGASYHDAIQQFMRDHGGRSPRFGNARDWPSQPQGANVTGVTTPSGAPAGAWGPVNLGARGRPYLDRIPEGMLSGRVALANGAGGAATTGSVGSRVAYVRVGERGYRLLVQRVSGSGWVTACEFGTQGGAQC